MPKLGIAIGLAALAGLLGAQPIEARPSRVVILRHGEKTDGPMLCKVGALRAEALAAKYLGKGAPQSDAVFGAGGKPEAFFAVTKHTQETAKPSADSWGKPIEAFSSGDLDRATRDAATALGKAEYDGKIVVVVWEHKHIAEQDASGDEDPNTFRALLELDKIPGANPPAKWDGGNYDYFWIVDYAGTPPTFAVGRQTYSDPAYAQVPDNAWGEKVDKSRFPDFYKDCEH